MLFDLRNSEKNI